MNAIVKRLTQITMLAAVAAAGFSMQPARAADKGVRVVQLPTVTVVGQRIPVIQLERVVVVGKRLAPAPAQVVVAQRNTRAAAI